MNFTFLFITLSAVLTDSASGTAKTDPIDIGSRRGLFVDRHLIERLDGARLAMHRPQPREVVMRFDKPWESYAPGYTTIIQDDEKGLSANLGASGEPKGTRLFRMYYRATHTPPNYDRGWNESTDQLPARRDRKEVSKHFKRIGTAVTDTLFIVSRDGVQFHVWPEAFVRPGIQRRGNWFYGDSGIALGFAETKSSFHESAPNELSFYVRENGRIEEPGQLRRYTLRLDGFASLNASLAGGSALTKPLVFKGDRLEINFSTSAGGSLRVEIQDADSNPVPGFAMDDCNLQYGDQIDRVVSWKSGTNVSQIAGQPVRLKFELKDADLYSFQFTPNAR